MLAGETLLKSRDFRRPLTKVRSSVSRCGLPRAGRGPSEPCKNEWGRNITPSRLGPAMSLYRCLRDASLGRNPIDHATVPDRQAHRRLAPSDWNRTNRDDGTFEDVSWESGGMVDDHEEPKRSMRLEVGDSSETAGSTFSSRTSWKCRTRCTRTPGTP